MTTRSRLTRPLAIGAAVIVIAGGTAGIVGATSGNGSAAATAGQTANVGPRLGSGSNARSGPAAGGVVGTVGGASSSGFTVTTAAGQKVTVKLTSSTTYQNGTPVLVLGTVNGTTITATQVVVRPAAGGSASYSPSKVTTFQRGAPATAKQDGKVPASYTEGSGTIVSGASAAKATTAALATYPGGIVDRVVKLSNGEYEVHNIGVNWPHHIFVSTSFEVVGAD
jgi:hypothetical protein